MYIMISTRCTRVHVHVSKYPWFLRGTCVIMVLGGGDLLGGNKQLESTGVLLDIYLYRQHSGSWNTPLMRITKRHKIATVL